MTKMGMKRAVDQTRSKINPLSQKEAKRLMKLRQLVTMLRIMADNKSELDGSKPTWESSFLVEPHHLNGRAGKHLTNVFEILMVCRGQHDYEQNHATFERKQELLAIVRDIRIRQGFKESDFA